MAVERIVAGHSGPGVEVLVFGSRARLDQRGGDIDLHVRAPGEKPARGEETRALGATERALGDLDVGLSLLGAGETPQRIDEAAVQTGVLL